MDNTEINFESDTFLDKYVYPKITADYCFLKCSFPSLEAERCVLPLSNP